jgi:hypothetical protein
VIRANLERRWLPVAVSHDDHATIQYAVKEGGFAPQHLKAGELAGQSFA